VREALKSSFVLQMLLASRKLVAVQEQLLVSWWKRCVNFSQVSNVLGVSALVYVHGWPPKQNVPGYLQCVAAPATAE
jgi:hypothetical protein